MSVQIDSKVETSAVPVLDLPLDHRRVAGRLSYYHSELSASVPAELCSRIASLKEQAYSTLPSIYLAGYAVLLSRYANTPEIDLFASSRTDRAEDCPAAVIRTNCLPDAEVREFLRAVTSQSGRTEDMWPGGRAQQGDASACQAGFVWDNRPDDHAVSTLSALSCLTSAAATCDRFDLSLGVRTGALGTQLVLRYRSDLFEADTVRRMSRHLLAILKDMVGRPQASLAELDALDGEERQQIFRFSAGSRTNYPRLCLHQLFEEQAALRPNAEAVVFEQERLTYRQLDEQSNQVAHFLTGQGICLEDRVGIFMNRSADMIVAMLGILKAGGAYVPIDPDYPAERLQFVAEDTAVRWVLTQHSVKSVLPSNAPSIYLDAANSPIRTCSRDAVANRSSSDSTAVVIYTSGSTGKPKAARIPHRAAIRTVRDQNYIRIVPEDRVTQAGSPSFDAAIMEIWLALANGATLIGLRRDTLLSLAELKSAVEKEHISVMVLNTSYVHQIGRENPEMLKGVRKIIFGGEAAEPEPLRALLHEVGPDVLVNGYGPAEGCVITTYHEISDLPQDVVTVPIGRPVNNAQVYLLDSFQRPVPIGMQGEIYIGGDGVASGYLNRPGLTTERFVPDLFSGQPGRLLYRTGDLARMRPDGQFEFRGRADEQIKIRGHRIELAEVREALSSHPDVKQVFLCVREDQPGDKRLVAYLTLRHRFAASQDLLRQHAKQKLPAYMIPSAFVILDKIPLNTNGKVDRNALPAHNERPNLAAQYQAPQSDLEIQLTELWQELLGIDHIGAQDNFFELGGHSLLAARLVSRIEKQTGQNIPVAMLFQAPTIAQLAMRLKQRNYASAWSPLVQLRAAEDKNGTLSPFFCVHSLGANLVSYHKIAALMDGKRAIYGLQPHGLDGQQKPLDSIESMAAAYLAEIRKKQPHGPYHLGGVCLGGVVAYEMAQQLRAAGERVDLLVLIDSFVPGKQQYLHTRPALTHYLDWHMGEMLLLGGMRRVTYLARWILNGGIRFRSWVGWAERSSLARATQEVGAAHRRAIFAYEPKPYSGRIVQLMCSDAAHRAYEDRRLAWSSLASEGFEIRIIPGNHLTMVEEPNVQVTAQELQRCLDRAGAAAPVQLSRRDNNEAPRKEYWRVA